jgi:hypothetical protein
VQPGTGDLRRHILARPGIDGAFGGLLLDWQYLASRESASLAEEGAWLSLRGVKVAVDFTSGTTLFPGLRLVDDMGVYYAQSLAAIRGVLAKMPLLGAADALIALHGTSEIPPANFSSDPVGLARESVRATLAMLAAEASSAGLTLHLRRTSRNTLLAGASLKEQCDFAASAGLKLAPHLAYVAISGDDMSVAASLFASGNATMLLLSSAWPGPGGQLREGAPLAALPADQTKALETLHAAAVGAAGSWVVLDAGYDSGEATGRAQELEDARVLGG